MAVMAQPQTVEAKPALSVSGFAGWMESEQRRVFLLCVRMLGNTEDADIAAQDTFLKAWKAIGKGDAEALSDPAKWVTRIAVNTCLDRLRSGRWQFWRRRPSAEDEALVLAFAPAPEPGPEKQALAVEIRERLAEALKKLSDRQRTIFVLRHYEGRSLEEVAAILGLEEGTVKAHAARALAKLRTELRDLYA